MTYHSGDNINQYGDGNIGKIVGVPTGDVATLISAANRMRAAVPPARQQDVSQALETVQTAGDDPRRLRPALETLRSLAAVAGSVGVPVIEAVRKVLDALNR